MQDEPTSRHIDLIGAPVSAMVDADDYAALVAYRWRLHSAGYAARTHDGMLMHRVILDLATRSGHAHKGHGLEVDHINQNRLDNRRANLRLVTRSENLRNRAGFGTSAHKGVHWDASRGKWRASAGRVTLGRFDTEAEAVAAVDAAETAGGLASPGGFVGTKLFVVPRGAPVHSMRSGEWTPAFRKQVIDLDKPGCEAQRYGDEWLIVVWPGSGGYWRRVMQRRGEFVAEWPA